MDRLEEATNRSAAFHIYADLCSSTISIPIEIISDWQDIFQVRNYGQVKAKFCDELGLIYFEAAPPGSPDRLELILPVNENESLLNLETPSRLIDITNRLKDQAVFNK